jgi:alpha-beta hydrolase superfamily lysophospholipase
MSPSVLIVPGLWEGIAPFKRVSELLSAEGFPTQITSLPSTGTKSPGNPSMLDDIASVRIAVETIVETGAVLILVAHSAGGFLASGAIEGLTVKHRQEKGLSGGVAKIVFLIILEVLRQKVSIMGHCRS